MKKTFSYSSNELSKPKQFIVNSIEKISGRKKLEKLYQQYDEENREPHLFWTDVKNLLKLRINVKSKRKLSIPKKLKKNYRLTIDTKEDFEVVKKILLHFKKFDFSLSDLIKYYNNHKNFFINHNKIEQKKIPSKYSTKMRWGI